MSKEIQIHRTSVSDTRLMKAITLYITNDSFTIDLADDRTVSVPLTWYPRLLYATSEERLHWRLIGNGQGFHWPDLDEDLNVENILLVKLPTRAGALSSSGWKKGKAGQPANQCDGRNLRVGKGLET